MKEFKYEIKKHIATVSKSDDGKIALEVNLISYKDHLQRWMLEHGTKKQERCIGESP